MSDPDLISTYNYDSFVSEKFERWLNFTASPPIGKAVPDFPLWHFEGTETRLSEIWSSNTYTIVEFGSFT